MNSSKLKSLAVTVPRDSGDGGEKSYLFVTKMIYTERSSTSSTPSTSTPFTSTERWYSRRESWIRFAVSEAKILAAVHALYSEDHGSHPPFQCPDREWMCRGGDSTGWGWFQRGPLEGRLDVTDRGLWRAAETGRGEIQPPAKSHRRSWARTRRERRQKG